MLQVKLSAVNDQLQIAIHGVLRDASVQEFGPDFPEISAGLSRASKLLSRASKLLSRGLPRFSRGLAKIVQGSGQNFKGVWAIMSRNSHRIVLGLAQYGPRI